MKLIIILLLCISLQFALIGVAIYLLLEDPSNGDIAILCPTILANLIFLVFNIKRLYDWIEDEETP